jgi:Flp pilus assembly protein TadG
MRLPALYRDQNGVAALEFAIVLPVLAVILFGILDFALLFYNKQVLTNASRELARYAIIAENAVDDPGFADQIDNILDLCNEKLVSLGGASVVTSDDINIDDDEDDSNYTFATIEFQYHHLFSDILDLNISSTELIGRTVMRNE